MVMEFHGHWWTIHVECFQRIQVPNSELANTDASRRIMPIQPTVAATSGTIPNRPSTAPLGGAMPIQPTAGQRANPPRGVATRSVPAHGHHPAFQGPAP